MKKHVRLILFFIMVGLVCSSTSISAELIESSIQHDQKDRGFLVYVPDTLLGTPSPLVFMFHGGGGTHYDVMSRTAEDRWNELAESESFIVAYPQGWEKNWNDCRADDIVGSLEDDIGFIDAVIDTLTAQYDIDHERIYACGMSNGGMFSFSLAVTRPDTFAAVFSCTGALPVNSECVAVPDSPISIMYLAGTADQWIPYDGGEVATFLGPGRGYVLSAAETLEYWKTQLQITATPIVNAIPDIVVTDGSTVTTYTYLEGAGGAELKYYEVDGGGHAWPAATPHTFFQEIILKQGKKNQDIIACDEAWAFFINQRLILNTPTPTLTVTPTATMTRTVSATNALSGVDLEDKDVLPYPHPGRDQVRFLMHFNEPSNVRIELYNISGEQVAGISQSFSAGRGQYIRWDCRDVAAGIYFARVLVNGSERKVMKIAIVK